MTDSQLVHHVPGDHEPVTAVHGSRIGRVPPAVVGDQALQPPVGPQPEVELDSAGLARRVRVLDGVRHDLDHGHMDGVAIVGKRAEVREPVIQRPPDEGEARHLAGQREVQRRDRDAETLCCQRGDIVGVARSGQQLDGQLADALRRHRCSAGCQHAVRDGARGHGGELGGACVQRPPRPLDEAVAVQQEHVAWRQSGGRERGHRSGSQRAVPGPVQEPDMPGAAGHERSRMAAGGVAESAAGGIENGQRESGRPQSWRPGRERVGAAQHFPQVRLCDEQLVDDGAQLRHRGSCRDSVTDNVTDRECHQAVRQRYRVEPVTASGLVQAGHQVPGRDARLRQNGERSGQERCLQARHYVPGGEIMLLRGAGRWLPRSPRSEARRHVESGSDDTGHLPAS